jgi:DNA invertase Pin-like site-specific DNA recombinase
MKDMDLILKGMKADCKDIEGMDSVTTLQEGLKVLAQNSVLGNLTAQQKFVEYGTYDHDYIRYNIPILYPFFIQGLQTLSNFVDEGVMNLHKNKKVYGYLRTTNTQDIDLAVKQLKDAGCESIFIDEGTDKIEYAHLMTKLKDDDTLILNQLIDVVNNTSDLLEFLVGLHKKGIRVLSLREVWIDSTSKYAIFKYQGLVALHNLDREFKALKQKQITEEIKDKGTKYGKKLSKDANFDLAVALYKEGKLTATEIAERCNMSRTTLWRYLKKIGLK